MFIYICKTLFAGFRIMQAYNKVRCSVGPGAVSRREEEGRRKALTGARRGADTGSVGMTERGHFGLEHQGGTPGGFGRRAQ